MTKPVWANVIHMSLIGVAAAVIAAWRARAAQKEMARAFNIIRADLVQGVARPERDAGRQFDQGETNAYKELVRKFNALTPSEQRGEEGQKLQAAVKRMRGTNADEDFFGIEKKRTTEINKLGDLAAARKAFGKFGVQQLDVKLSNEFDHWDWIVVTLPVTLIVMFIVTMLADVIADAASGQYAGQQSWEYASIRALFVSIATSSVLMYLVIANPPKTTFTVGIYATLVALAAVGADFILETVLVTPSSS